MARIVLLNVQATTPKGRALVREFNALVRRADALSDPDEKALVYSFAAENAERLSTLQFESIGGRYIAQGMSEHLYREALTLHLRGIVESAYEESFR